MTEDLVGPTEMPMGCQQNPERFCFEDLVPVDQSILPLDLVATLPGHSCRLVPASLSGSHSWWVAVDPSA